MLAAESPAAPHIHRPKPGSRRPLQPKNIIPAPKSTPKEPQKHHHTPHPIPPIDYAYAHSNKENYQILASPIEPIDASLAEELTAVRQKLERLRLDREKTEKILQGRDSFLDFQIVELEQRGEFQKELEIEVDRLYRLKQLKLACTRMSPILSLREKEMEKKTKESQSEIAESEESKEEFSFQSSATESSALTLESSSASTSALTSNSTATSKLSLLLPRLSFANASESFNHG